MENETNAVRLEKIQQGAMETKLLFEQRQYNLSMIKSRQTLELMVNFLGDKAYIIDCNLMEATDRLMQDGWISNTSCDHYHTIRMLGNKAAHDGDDGPDNALQAYRLLSEEVRTFATDYITSTKRAVTPSSRADLDVGYGNRSRRTGQDSSNSSTTRRSRSDGSSQNSERRSRSGSSDQHRQHSSSSHRTAAANRSRKRPPEKRRRKGRTSPYALIKLLSLLLIVLLVILLATKYFFPSAENKPSTISDNSLSSSTTMPVTTAPPQPGPEETPTTAPPETTPPATAPPETTPAAPTVYKSTADNLNVRVSPEANAQIRVQLPAGTTIEFVKIHDDKWSQIRYNGQDAYVASQYIKAETTAAP